MTLDDLTIGAALSDDVTVCRYKVAPGAEAGEDWPVAEFGHDDTLRDTARVVMDHVRGSETRGETAGEAAALVAWLLTNRDDLLTMARRWAEVEPLLKEWREARDAHYEAGALATDEDEVRWRRAEHALLAALRKGG